MQMRGYQGGRLLTWLSCCLVVAVQYTDMMRRKMFTAMRATEIRAKLIMRGDGAWPWLGGAELYMSGTAVGGAKVGGRRGSVDRAVNELKV